MNKYDLIIDSIRKTANKDWKIFIKEMRKKIMEMETIELFEFLSYFREGLHDSGIPLEQNNYIIEIITGIRKIPRNNPFSF